MRLDTTKLPGRRASMRRLSRHKDESKKFDFWPGQPHNEKFLTFSHVMQTQSLIPQNYGGEMTLERES